MSAPFSVHWSIGGQVSSDRARFHLIEVTTGRNAGRDLGAHSRGSVPRRSKGHTGARTLTSPLGYLYIYIYIYIYIYTKRFQVPRRRRLYRSLSLPISPQFSLVARDPREATPGNPIKWSNDCLPFLRFQPLHFRSHVPRTRFSLDAHLSGDYATFFLFLFFHSHARTGILWNVRLPIIILRCVLGSISARALIANLLAFDRSQSSWFFVR